MMEIKRVTKSIFITILTISFSNLCIGQSQRFFGTNISDKLIKIDFSKKKQIVKVYDEDLIKKKELLRENSFILPEGFSDYYAYDIIKTIKCNKKNKLLFDAEISRKDILTFPREKIDTIIFYKKSKDSITLMLSVLRIEE